MMFESKKDLLKISASAVLLVAGIILGSLIKLNLILKIIIFAAAYLIVGAEVIKEAFEDIKDGEIFGENLLMCIASLGAFIIGEYAEAVFVMLFFGVGELLEEIATSKSRNTIKALLEIRPDTAVLLKGEEEVVVNAESIKVGDIITVRAGERIALDGVISEGETFTDNSSVTGESVPVFCKVGDPVFSGTINKTAYIKIKVTATFKNSTASRILDAVQNAAKNKSQKERFITRFAKIYTPTVCISALLLAIIPSVITGELRVWILRALTFLVVSCPCALVVSVPLAYFCGIGFAAKRGILIKGAAYAEALSDIKTAVFDKTGTLTKGKFSVVAVHPEKISEKEILSLAASAEQYSNHPIAYAFKNIKCDLSSLNDVKEISGGITALFGNKTLIVGNAELLNENGISSRECHKTGTVIHVALDGVYLGHIVISDTVKDDSKETVKELKKLGIKTVMLSGDKVAAAELVKTQLGIDEVKAELKPEEKVYALEKYLSEDTCTAFIGDGINDAPALTRADVGIAMGALGSDSAVAAADIVIMNDKISDLLLSVKISKKIGKIAKENIYFSIFVKLAVLLLCGLGIGVTNMWIAAFADVGVLALAVLNSFRLL